MTTGSETMPGLAMRFEVNVESYALSNWTKASGLEVQWDLCEYRAGDGGNDRWYFPGLTKYSTIRLERAANAADSGLVKSWLESNSFQHAPQTGSIVLLDAQRERVHEWKLRHVLPVKWSIGAFDAAVSKVALETLELAHMGFLENE